MELIFQFLVDEWPTGVEIVFGPEWRYLPHEPCELVFDYDAEVAQSEGVRFGLALEAPARLTFMVTAGQLVSMGPITERQFDRSARGANVDVFMDISVEDGVEDLGMMHEVFGAYVLQVDESTLRGVDFNYGFVGIYVDVFERGFVFNIMQGTWEAQLDKDGDEIV